MFICYHLLIYITCCVARLLSRNVNGLKYVHYDDVTATPQNVDRSLLHNRRCCRCWQPIIRIGVGTQR